MLSQKPLRLFHKHCAHCVVQVEKSPLLCSMWCCQGLPIESEWPLSMWGALLIPHRSRGVYSHGGDGVQIFFLLSVEYMQLPQPWALSFCGQTPIHCLAAAFKNEPSWAQHCGDTCLHTMLITSSLRHWQENRLQGTSSCQGPSLVT